MTFQGIFWNCRGLRKKGVTSFLKDLIFQYQFHFVGLQETMIKNCDDSLIRSFDIHQEYLWKWIPSNGRSGGILVGIKLEQYDVGSFKQGEYMLQMNLWDELKRLKWNLLVVYGDAQEENKMAFLTELSKFCSNNSDPMLIGRDFNIIRYANEKNKKGGVQKYTDLFNRLIYCYELREMVMTGGMYTWSNNQENPTLEKLDRVLMIRQWEDIFPQIMVKKLPREVSDHNPLIISSMVICTKKPLHFRFELNWLHNDDFYPIVEQIWNKPCKARSVLDRIQQKLKLFKQYFKGWGFNLQGELRKKRRDIQKELTELELMEEIVGLHLEHVERKALIISENMKLLEQEHMYWYNRCNEKWLLKGDNNTEFFHKCANGKKGKILLFL